MLIFLVSGRSKIVRNDLPEQHQNMKNTEKKTHEKHLNYLEKFPVTVCYSKQPKLVLAQPVLMGFWWIKDTGAVQYLDKAKLQFPDMSECQQIENGCIVKADKNSISLYALCRNIQYP